MTIRHTVTKQDNWSWMLFGTQGSARELASAYIGQNYARIARPMLLRERSRQNAAALGCSGRHHRNDARECNSQGSGSGHRAAGLRVNVVFALHRRLAAQLLELGLCECRPITALCRSRVRVHDEGTRRTRLQGSRPIAALGIRKRRAASCLHRSLTSGWRRGGSDLDGKLLRVKELGVRSAAPPKACEITHATEKSLQV